MNSPRHPGAPTGPPSARSSAPSPTRRRPTGGIAPILVLVVVALIPAIVLLSLSRWAAGKADAADDAVPVPNGVPTNPGEAPAALNTGLFSMRRTASILSHDLNFAAFETAVEPLLSVINDRSCAVVMLNGEVV